MQGVLWFDAVLAEQTDALKPGPGTIDQLCDELETRLVLSRAVRVALPVISSIFFPLIVYWTGSRVIRITFHGRRRVDVLGRGDRRATRVQKSNSNGHVKTGEMHVRCS